MPVAGFVLTADWNISPNAEGKIPGIGVGLSIGTLAPSTSLSTNASANTYCGKNQKDGE